MKNQTKTEEEFFTYKDFVAYLLIYAANADLEISKKESDKIIELVGEEEYEHILSLQDGHNDYEAIQFIEEQGAIFIESQEDKNALLGEMKNIILADGKITQLETEILSCIKKLL